MPKKAAKKTQNKVSEEIWPQERMFFERPERYLYVRKIIRPKGCVFCHALEKKPTFENLVLWKGDHSVVMMNKFPYNTGHLLILPIHHEGTLWNLKSDEQKELHRVLVKSAEILQKIMGCAGMNMGLNHGAVAGAGIPEHVHWHIVPRWFGDTNFFPLIAETKVLPQTLEQTYDKLKPHFAKLKLK